MDFNLALKVNSIVTMLIGLATIPALNVATLQGDGGSEQGLWPIFGVCFLIGLLLAKVTHQKKVTVKPGDAYVLTLICWVVACIIGAFPFYFSGNGYSFIDCIFESTTGFTTTGCSVIPTDDLPDALIMWKATTHWLGGMGILILMVSIFSFLGINGLNMASTESPGQGLYKNKANVRETTRFLFRAYLSFTVLEFLLFLPSGMSPYDAIVNTMSTISTGGLMVRQEALPFFSMGYVKIIVTIFSIISSISFMLYFFIIKRDKDAIKKNFEVRYYFGIIIISSILIISSLMISGQYSSFGAAFEDGAYEAVAATSTSGFTSCGYDKWPFFAQSVLIIQMLIGGCAGSTAGSIKVVRFAVMIQLIKRGMYKFIHPQAVKPIRFGKEVLSAERVGSITLFSFLYFAVFGLGCLLLSLDNQDMYTTITSVVSMMSNAGMNLGEVGVTGTYAFYSDPAKILLCLLSIAGRLEIFSVVFVFSSSFWRKDRANF